MSIHLSSDQISKFLIGEATADEERHIRECIECMEELTRFQTTLSGLRLSVQNWTAETSSSVSDNGVVRIRRPRLVLRRASWAAAALTALVAIPIYRNAHQREKQLKAAEDTLLLEHVNAHLSRAIPAPMEPMMRLVTDINDEQAGGRK